MRFHDFKKRIQTYPIFNSRMFFHLTDDVALLRRQVSEWIAKGYILQLKRGVYCLSDEWRQTQFSRLFLANQLYLPSYVSVESALSIYGMIPEEVATVTSISTKKTQHFENYFGCFNYLHIRSSLFADFIQQQDEFGNKFYIASKERALVDLFYYRTRHLKKIDSSIFEQSFRLQNVQDIDDEKIAGIARKFNVRRMDNITALFLKTKLELP